jgi:hypothetical protein
MMPDDSLELMVSMVEKAFFRLQAGDILVTCLENGNVTPMRAYVEDLVLAGPGSLNALREMRVEASTRRRQFQDEIAETFTQFESKLVGYGVSLSNLTERLLDDGLDTSGFISYLDQHGIADESDQKACMLMIHNTKETMYSLANQILLLQEVELFLEDWIWGLAYQSARQTLADNHFTGMKSQFVQ